MSDYYVNGVIPSIGKRIAKFAFNNKFHKFEHDKEEHCFNVYVKPGVDTRVIDHFKKHWPGFKIYVIQAEEA